MKSTDDSLLYYIRKYDAFTKTRWSRKKVRRALRLLRYKEALLLRIETDKPRREVAV